MEELLGVLDLGIDVDLGGDPDIGTLGEEEFDVPELGNERRYQPPE